MTIPICVATRRDGKTLVTGLWVDHSVDIGMPVDPTSIMYRPLRDLNGILGAKSLVVCLTGYQRQDRDDIMTMVGLMGANFSKPLVANKVTHLVCYRFEGEKYELAKKMKKIKLINHQWLEDCLKAWEILPEANYDKSGYELEKMEAEAKDSEEEANDISKMQHVERIMNASPRKLQTEMACAQKSPISKEEISKNVLDASASKGLSNVGNTNDMVITNRKEIISDQGSTLHDIHEKHSEVPGSRDSRISDVSCGEASEQPSKTFKRTPVSAKVGHGLASTSGSTKRSPYSDAVKLSSTSYTKKMPRRTTLSMHSGEMASNTSLDKFNASDGFGISSSKIEQAEDGTGSGCAKTPLKGIDLCHQEGLSATLPEKRKLDVSCGSSKSQKMSHNPKAFIAEGLLVSNRTEGLEPASLIDGPSEINNCLSVGNNAHCLDEHAALRPVPVNISATKSPSFNRRLSPHDMTTESVASEIRQDGNAKEAPQTLSIGLKKTSLAGKLDVEDVAMSRQEHAVSEVREPQNKLQDADVSSPRIRGLEYEKSNTAPNLNLLNEGNAESLSKPLRRKMIAKKSLGSRQKLGKSNTANKKGSIYSNKTASHVDAVTCSIVGEETADHKKFVNSEKLEMVPPTVDVDEAKGMETSNVSKYGNEVENKTLSMYDETEAPDDKDEREFEASVIGERPEEVGPANMVDKVTEEKSEDANCITKKTKAKTLGMHDHTMTSGEDESGSELEKAVSGKNTELDKLNCKQNVGKGKITKGKKYPLSKSKKKTVPSVMETRKSNEDVTGEKTKSKKKNEKMEMEKERCISYPAGKTKRTVPVNKSENSMEVEKENRPTSVGDKNVSYSKQWVGKVASKSTRTPMKIDVKAGDTSWDSVQVERVLKVQTESVWFILSGHKLQRKEFQKIIRRLKGRVCRDSHQWSYQATHFIVPDPIRRTEKFFAAAASGRWILKTDYLTSSNQEGSFLAEEPYEWHKNGLNEDGAINLEAPRKWRLLRERTGHGAFYGMRIVIYGECIAPPLDTLKRVVNAGDGIILATSPPYTRFLKSGIDFAIVSPGMPRVDIWVQEFLRHEIPCVVADYLVEYVCKPGYSLERHVQYNTHTWVEKSFANLLSRSEEVVEGQRPHEDYDDSDLPCQVCGSRDRGEVMLICGDENGTTGCGIGTHIDCCDPPLEDVPEEDWFCPKCSNKSTKKGTSLSKSK
ncbi:hypothetical protein F0562_000782 [Nyssa sinensis]|uniref:BRCT domain-containing protein n=1 Tax=Nyssa sinensis TaxID=561372 RepID=A0A5J5C1E9_9ASTE|nr:hypothetical protein F0562_000782 [Nyssa sinensis]